MGKVEKAIQALTLAMCALVLYVILDVFITVRKIQQSKDQDECTPVEMIESLKEQGKELENYGNL